MVLAAECQATRPKTGHEEGVTMLIIAHANHPEMFVAGLVAGVLLTLAHMAYRRVTKK